VAKIITGQASDSDMANLEAVGLASMEKVIADVKSGKEGALPTLATLVMASDKNAVYLRTSGTLSFLCRQLLDHDSMDEKSITRILSVLAAAVSMENKCRVVVMEEGVLLHALEHFVSNRGGEAHCMTLRMASSCLANHDCGRVISTSKEVVQRLLSSLHGDDASQPLSVEGINLAASLLSDILLLPSGQKTLSSIRDLEPPQAVARQLQAVSLQYKECRQTLIGLLANLALVEAMRGLFVGEPVRVLLATCKGGDTSASWAFALAGLMNACLEPTMAVREDLFRAGACDVMLSILSAKPELRKRIPQEIWSRAAGLVSRLVNYPEAREYLSYSEKAGIVSTALLSTSDQGEREHLVRILAALIDGTNARTLLDHDSVRSLTRCLPEPRKDIGSVVTAETVSLPPHQKISDVFAVSITKCLIHAVDSPYCSSFCDELGPERMVSLLANSKDGPVRKNAAIIIAKIVKGGGAVADRIRALRGMEMILQMGNRLV